MLTRIRRLSLGHTGDSKHVGAGVHELRVHFAGGLRLYFGMAGRSLVILLCGGDKRGQARDIARAKRLWTDYQQEQTHESAHSV
jgi:putative addiction module killer protein